MYKRPVRGPPGIICYGDNGAVLCGIDEVFVDNAARLTWSPHSTWTTLLSHGIVCKGWTSCDSRDSSNTDRRVGVQHVVTPECLLELSDF